MAKHSRSIATVLIYFGIGLVIVSIVIIGRIFYPVIRDELSYRLNSNKKATKVVMSYSKEDINSSEKILIPLDKQFGIVIPKLDANAKIIQNIDPNNSLEYQRALTEGVAHSKGSSFPGNGGNTFLFAHSSDNFYNANLYNSIFYLLNKLEGKDVFFISFKEKLYEYEVVEKKIVNPEEVDYLSPTMREQGKETATLMTCWPPGTTLKRLIVVGTLKEKD